MFMYFPENYGWSLVVLRNLVSGGHFGEIDWVCQNLRDAAKQSPRGDTKAWCEAWKVLADQVNTLAEERVRSGHLVTARDLFYRAALYYQWVEAFLPPSDPDADRFYKQHLQAFAKFAQLSSPQVEIVDIPFEGTSLKAYFIPPHRTDHRPAASAGKGAPCVIVCGGLDGTKEEMFPLAKAMADRGMAALGLDLPGQGDTLRGSGLAMRHDTEIPIGAAIDYLEGRGDIAPQRIGIAATSAGGYYAPRAAAFEKRIKACVPWSACYDYYAIWQRRLAFENGKPTGIKPTIPFPVTEELVLRIIGAQDWSEALNKFEKFRLSGVAEKIECDFLVVHGEDDPQTPLIEAQRLYDEAKSKNKQLVVYRRAEGGSAHVQVDRQEPAMSLIADWLEERLAV